MLTLFQSRCTEHPVAYDPKNHYLIAWSDERGALESWDVKELEGMSAGADFEGRLGASSVLVKAGEVEGCLKAVAKLVPRVVGRLESTVYSLSVHPGGRLVAAGCDDGFVRVYNLKERRLLAALPHGGPAYSVAYKPDGSLLVSAGETGLAKVWGPDLDETPQATLPRGFPVHAVSFSGDGGRLAFSGARASALVVDLGPSRAIRYLNGLNSDADIDAIAFSPDGRLLATGGDDGYVTLWDPDRGRRRAWFDQRGLSSGHVAEAGRPTPGRRPEGPRQEVLAFAEPNEVVREVRDTGEEGPARARDGGPDLLPLVRARGRRARARTRSLGAVQEFFPFAIRNRLARITSVAFSTDGGRLAATSDDGRVVLWNLRDEEPPRVIGGVGSDESFWSAAFVPRQHLLAVGCSDGAVHLYGC